MKFSTSTVSAISILSSSFLSSLHTAEAWVSQQPTFSTSLQPQLTQQPTHLNGKYSFTTSTTSSHKLATTTEESEDDAAPVPALTSELAVEKEEERIIGEGTIISYFPGGLAAVRTSEEDGTFDEDGKTIAPPSPQAGLTAPPTKVTGRNDSTSTLGGDLLGHKVRFPDGSEGVVIVHRPPIAYVYSDFEMEGNNGVVKIMEEMSSVKVPEGQSEPVLTWKGGTSDVATKERAIFAHIPKVSDIALINEPMLTGITMFDALAPIGRGQNMLFIGDDIESMRAYVCDFIASQMQQEDVKVVYAATENSDEAIAQLKKAGVLDAIQLVSTDTTKFGADKIEDKTTLAAEAISVAATACAIGESHVVENGKHSLVIVDTINQHKQFWDATTRVLVDEFGVDSVVEGEIGGSSSSEMRAFYSALIQRAGCYKKTKGGGSLTLLLLTTLPSSNTDEDDVVYTEKDFQDSSNPKIVERVKLLASKGLKLSAANLRKINIPIPSVSEGKRRQFLQHIDDLISMSDGQIWLTDVLAKRGQRPPMDSQRSITRVGIGADTDSQADAPALRKLIQGMRLEIAQSTDMGGAEDNNASTKQRRYRNALLLAMHQEPGQGGRQLSQSCTALLAASKGFLNDAIDNGAMAGNEEGTTVINHLLEHVANEAPNAMKKIDETLDLPEDVEEEIIKAFQSFF